MSFSPTRLMLEVVTSTKAFEAATRGRAPQRSGVTRPDRSLSLPEVVNAIGLNIIHRVDREPAFDYMHSVTNQRQYVFPCSSMFKPIFICKPVEWSPGSHSSDAPFAVHHLYMFHLRWFDLPSGLRRLKRTREMPWASAEMGTQARLGDDQCVQGYRGFAGLQPIENCDFDPLLSPVREFTEMVHASTVSRENDLYKLDLSIWGDRIWQLPPRFIGTF